MFVRRWMTSPPSILFADTPAGDALRFMESRGFGHLAVLGPDGLQGLVTPDGLRAALRTAEPWAPRRPLVIGVVAEPCVRVAPSETMERAVQLLVERRASALAVIDGGGLVGLLSVGDALRALASLLESHAA